MSERQAAAKKPPRSGIASRAATRGRQAAFLAAFVRLGVVTYAARAARISRAIVYHWRDTDPRFEVRFQVASEEVADLLETEARRRALDGWEEEVYQGGVLVGTVRKYSRQMLILLLRGPSPGSLRASG